MEDVSGMSDQARTTRRMWRGVLFGAAALAMTMMTGTTVQAKHGGGGLALPIIGGLAGGGLLTSAIYQQHEISQMQGQEKSQNNAATTAAPEYIYVPAQPAYTTASYPAYPAYSNDIQGRLQELDSICAQGLVSPSQCAQRRQQILNGL